MDSRRTRHRAGSPRGRRPSPTARRARGGGRCPLPRCAPRRPRRNTPQSRACAYLPPPSRAGRRRTTARRSPRFRGRPPGRAQLSGTGKRPTGYRGSSGAAWQAGTPPAGVPIRPLSIPAAARVFSGAATNSSASAVAISCVVIAAGSASRSSGAFASHPSDGDRKPSKEMRSNAYAPRRATAAHTSSSSGRAWGLPPRAPASLAARRGSRRRSALRTRGHAVQPCQVTLT